VTALGPKGEDPAAAGTPLPAADAAAVWVGFLLSALTVGQMILAPLPGALGRVVAGFLRAVVLAVFLP
jgi:hypothetical protein